MQFYEYEIISFVIVMYWLRLALSAVSVVLRAFAGSDPYSQQYDFRTKGRSQCFLCLGETIRLAQLTETCVHESLQYNVEQSGL